MCWLLIGRRALRAFVVERFELDRGVMCALVISLNDRRMRVAFYTKFTAYYPVRNIGETTHDCDVMAAWGQPGNYLPFSVNLCRDDPH